MSGIWLTCCFSSLRLDLCASTQDHAIRNITALMLVCLPWWIFHCEKTMIQFLWVFSQFPYKIHLYLQKESYYILLIYFSGWMALAASAMTHVTLANHRSPLSVFQHLLQAYNVQLAYWCISRDPLKTALGFSVYE